MSLPNRDNYARLPQSVAMQGERIRNELNQQHMVTVYMDELTKTINETMKGYIGQKMTNANNYTLNQEDPYYHLNIQIDRLKKDLKLRAEEFDAVCGLISDFKRESEILKKELRQLVDSTPVEDMEMIDAGKALHDSDRQCEEWQKLFTPNGMEGL
jgi:hypothetical protein